MSYSTHIEKYLPIYVHFGSLLRWTQEDKGQELPPGFWMVQKVIAKVDKYLFPSCTGRCSVPGLGRGIMGCFPGVFLLLRRSCSVGCDVLWVINLCNPAGTISTVLHLSSMLALGKTLIQGATQLVQLASNFSPLQVSTL